jgi:hypothetical protein
MYFLRSVHQFDFLELLLRFGCCERAMTQLTLAFAVCLLPIPSHIALIQHSTFFLGTFCFFMNASF